MKNKRELRLELILEYLETNHSATVIGLSEAFRVSKTTIRQDLDLSLIHIFPGSLPRIL